MGEHERSISDLRAKFKGDLETLKKLEKEDIRTRYAEHEKSQKMMQSLLESAKDEIRHLRAQQEANNRDITNAIGLLDPKTMKSKEACLQLKRCMELSLANQKLDDLFLDKKKKTQEKKGILIGGSLGGE